MASHASPAADFPAIEYDLNIHDGEVMTVFRLRDSGIRLVGDRIEWAIDRRPQQKALAGIKMIRLTTAVETPRGPMGATSCQILFRGGWAVTVFGGNSLSTDATDRRARRSSDLRPDRPHGPAVPVGMVPGPELRCSRAAHSRRCHSPRIIRTRRSGSLPPVSPAGARAPRTRRETQMLRHLQDQAHGTGARSSVSPGGAAAAAVAACPSGTAVWGPEWNPFGKQTVL